MDPVRFVSDVLGEHLWSKQREILDSVVVNRRTAVPSAFGTGKSWSAARLVAWWIASHEPGTAMAVTTAPTGPQVKAILWKEINRAARAGKLPGRLLQTEWWLEGEQVAIGRKPSDYNPEAFQGIHAEFVLVVLDEAAGIERPIWDAAGGLVTTPGSRILAIGNPTDGTSEFAKICAPASGWNVIPISVFDSPNFTGEVVPAEVAGVLPDPIWVEEKRRDWGEGTPMWTAKVLGRFPDSDPQALIPLSWAMRAAERTLEHGEPVEIGVDVAREGSDSTEIYIRHGSVARRAWGGHEPDTMATAGRVIAVLRETGASVAKIDKGGVGGGPLDRLVEQKIPAVGVGFGDSPSTEQGRERFRYRRDEMYWGLRCRFEDGDIDIDPTDEMLIAQLTSMHWRQNSRGQIEIESKAEMRKRGLRSPDRADALAMAFATSPTGQGAAFMEYWRGLLAADTPSAPEDDWARERRLQATMQL